MSRTLAERSLGERTDVGGLWWMGIEATAVWTLGTAAGPRSGEDVRVASGDIYCPCVVCSCFHSFLLLPVPCPVLFHSCSAGGRLLTAPSATHHGHVCTHCLPRVSSNQPSPFVLFFVFFFLFSNTPGPDSLQKSELQPYSVQVWFQGQY